MVLGSAWTTVLELPASAQGRFALGFLRDATSPVGTSGARLLHTALLNVLIASDGSVYAGAVTPQWLQHVAATHH